MAIGFPNLPCISINGLQLEVDKKFSYLGSVLSTAWTTVRLGIFYRKVEVLYRKVEKHEAQIIKPNWTKLSFWGCLLLLHMLMHRICHFQSFSQQITTINFPNANKQNK